MLMIVPSSSHGSGPNRSGAGPAYITAYVGFAPETTIWAGESSCCPKTSISIFPKPLTNFSFSSRTSADFFTTASSPALQRKEQISSFANASSAFLLSSLWILGGYYSHWHFCQSLVSEVLSLPPVRHFLLTFSLPFILSLEYAGGQDRQRKNPGLRGRIGGKTTPPSRLWQTPFLRMKQVGRGGYSSIPCRLPSTSDCVGTSATHRWLICIYPHRDCFLLNGPLILPSGEERKKGRGGILLHRQFCFWIKRKGLQQIFSKDLRIQKQLFHYFSRYNRVY